MEEKKKGDLTGVFSIDVFHAGTNDELAYTIIKDENGEEIIVILIGTSENFYETLKRYLK